VLLQYLSWVGNALICWGLWNMGNKKRSAFVASLVGESLWIVYAAHAHLWSLAFICSVFALIAARNWFKWGSENNG